MSRMNHVDVPVTWRTAFVLQLRGETTSRDEPTQEDARSVAEESLRRFIEDLKPYLPNGVVVEFGVLTTLPMPELDDPQLMTPLEAEQ